MASYAYNLQPDYQLQPGSAQGLTESTYVEPVVVELPITLEDHLETLDPELRERAQLYFTILGWNDTSTGSTTNEQPTVQVLNSEPDPGAGLPGIGYEVTGEFSVSITQNPDGTISYVLKYYILPSIIGK